MGKKHSNTIKFKCIGKLPAGIASAKKGLQKVNLEAALFLEMPWDRGVGDQLALEELS